VKSEISLDIGQCNRKSLLFITLAVLEFKFTSTISRQASVVVNQRWWTHVEAIAVT